MDEKICYLPSNVHRGSVAWLLFLFPVKTHVVLATNVAMIEKRPFSWLSKRAFSKEVKVKK